MKKKINQNLINLIEYYKLLNLDIIVSNYPIKRNSNDEDLNFTGSKKEKLEKLKRNINNIKNCNLKKNAKNIVFGDGNINSKVMIVGEGPGAQEDFQGLPFVGRAGQLLDKMLFSIKLSRKSVYITNVVNYRPPENRKPTDEEIKRYYPFLKSHIEIISPKILLLMGSTALNAVVSSEKTISQFRGKWLNTKIGSSDLWIIASFHPAFLMRQPEQKKLAWVDLKMIRAKIKELKL